MSNFENPQQQNEPQHGYSQQQSPQPQSPQPQQSPQQFPQPGYPQQQGYPQPPTNTLAIIALVTSLVFAPAGVVTGHIALSQIKKSGESGRGLAIAGLVIGWVQVGFALLVLLFFLLFGGVLFSVFWQEVTSEISDPLMISLVPALL